MKYTNRHPAATHDHIQRTVDEGTWPAAQFALARGGDILESTTFGDATDADRFCMFSATKPVVASAVWQLIGEELIAPATRIAEVWPRVRGTRQGSRDPGAGAAAHLRFPQCDVQRWRRPHPRATHRADRRVAAGVGAWQPVRVSRVLGPLGARGGDRAGHRTGLPHGTSLARARSARPRPDRTGRAQGPAGRPQAGRADRPPQREGAQGAGRAAGRCRGPGRERAGGPGRRQRSGPHRARSARRQRVLRRRERGPLLPGAAVELERGVAAGRPQGRDRLGAQHLPRSRAHVRTRQPHHRPEGHGRGRGSLARGSVAQHVSAAAPVRAQCVEARLRTWRRRWSVRLGGPGDRPVLLPSGQRHGPGRARRPPSP
ncbi:serine hydrolase [Streptomyces sp. SID8361]|nr:serine hydrolase [Streptomyces sp. SID8361]